MAVELKAYNTLIGNRLTLSQTLQFHLNVYNNAGADLESIPELADLVNAWKLEVLNYDESFRSSGQRFETKVVTGKDTGRDNVTRALVGYVTTLANHPMSDEEKTDGDRLSSIVETYKKADRREYESETTFLRNMIADMRKYPSLLTKYRLSDIVDRLEVENDAFNLAFNERTAIRQEIKDHGDLQEHRKSANFRFDNVGKAVTGLLLMPTTPEVKAKLVKSVGTINANIDQFTTIHNRHAGLVAKRKKKDDDKDDEGNQTPGGNTPSTPDAPNQNPDNTLPSAPDTPNQNPGTGPHPLDPNEHPSMGEH